MDIADIIGLQEVHGTTATMHELFNTYPGWRFFVSCSPSAAAGGVAILIQGSMLCKVKCIIPQVFLAGRALRVLLQFDTFALNILSLHVEPAATRQVQRDMLFKALSSAEPSLHCTVVLADLSSCLPGDGRLHLHSMQHSANDDWLGGWLSSSFPRFTIADHDGYTRIGKREGVPSVLSRIDYILTDMDKPTVLDSRFSGYTVGDLFNLTASDHVAVVAAYHPPRSSPSSRSLVPSWISSTDLFKTIVNQLIHQHLKFYMDVQRDDLIEIFHVAAQRCTTSQ
jgi:hypothetical protein